MLELHEIPDILYYIQNIQETIILLKLPFSYIHFKIIFIRYLKYYFKKIKILEDIKIFIYLLQKSYKKSKNRAFMLRMLLILFTLTDHRGS